jgi:ubiquitin-like-conjugating enzyme ATG10
MPIANFPHLRKAEFAEACHYLDRQYCRATLGPLRKTWKLRLCTALDTSFSSDGAYTAYIQITRPLDKTIDPDDLSFAFGKFSLAEKDTPEVVSASGLEGDMQMTEAEEADKA